jgi:hypothetical protein
LERELDANQLLRNLGSHIRQQRLSWRNKRNVGETQGTMNKIADNEGFRGPVVLRVASSHAAPKDIDYGAVVVADGGARVAKGRKRKSTLTENDLLLVVYDDPLTAGQYMFGSDFGYVVGEKAISDICRGAFLVHCLSRCGLLKPGPTEFQKVLGCAKRKIS